MGTILAGVVGILPNALIKLIKTIKYAEREEIVNDREWSTADNFLVWISDMDEQAQTLSAVLEKENTWAVENASGGKKEWEHD